MGTVPEPRAFDPRPVPLDILQVDHGNMAAFDPRPVDTARFTSEKSANSACLELGRDIMQSLAAELFSLPSRNEELGRFITLPAPTTPLPREKPLPRPRAPTKWEKFAKSKGIVKKKRSKLVYDEDAKDWKRRYGYKRANDENDQVVIEAKSTDEPGTDPFEERAKAKKARVEKNEKQRMRNLAETAKKVGKSALPSTVQLAATSLPLQGGRPAKRGKAELGEVAGLARSATASIGKFDKKLPGEKGSKVKGKKRKFLPAEGTGEERKQVSNVLAKILAKNDHENFDIGKAVSMYNVQEQSTREAKNKQGSGDGPKKKKFEKGKHGGKGGAQSKGGKGAPKGKAGMGAKSRKGM